MEEVQSTYQKELWERRRGREGKEEGRRAKGKNDGEWEDWEMVSSHGGDRAKFG